MYGSVSKDQNANLSIVVPNCVTNYQARRALLEANLFVTVDTMIKSLDSADPIYQAWEYANLVYRNSEFVLNLGQQLGLTDEQIDNLFIEANKLQ